MAFLEIQKQRGLGRRSQMCRNGDGEAEQKTNSTHPPYHGVSRPFRIRCGIAQASVRWATLAQEPIQLHGDWQPCQPCLTPGIYSKLGEVLISEETRLLVQDHFTCVPKEMIQVKGFARPIQTYVVKEALDQDPATALALHAPGVDLEIDPTQLSPEISGALQDLLRQARHLVTNSSENQN